MAGAFSAVDLSRLPFPSAVQPLDFETILAAMLTDLRARAPEFTALVESDPAMKVLEVAAFRELLIRQRVNEAVKAVTLAYSAGADLDQIAARYDVERLMIDAGDPDTIPPVPPTFEDDESLRRRVQLSFEGFSTAGPKGAYIFHALGADANVLDAGVDAPRFSKAEIDSGVMATLPPNSIVLQVDYDAGLADPMPGDVVVSVLSRTGNGAASTELLDSVRGVLAAEDVRPLTDNALVRSAEIVNYTIVATLRFYSGPDAAVVMQAARDALDAYVARNHKLSRDVTRAGIIGALAQEGVQNVILTTPASDVVIEAHQAAHCIGITLTDGGVYE